jgi:hypothetical protein
MAPHQPSANAISAPTIYTLLVSPADHISCGIHFRKSIIMTRHVDYQLKGCAGGDLPEFNAPCCPVNQYGFAG